MKRPRCKYKRYLDYEKQFYCARYFQLVDIKPTKDCKKCKDYEPPNNSWYMSDSL